MDKELLEQFQMLANLMGNMATKEDIANLATKDDLREEIRQSETRVKLFIENTVTDKIKSLFDGYQSALENQALLKVANETLAKELDDIKSRLQAIESKIA